MKNYILILAFLFTCLWVDAQTYLQENFDTEIPATWTITDEGGATGDSWISGTQGFLNQSLDGSNGAIVDSDSNGNGTLLVETLTSPVFDTTGAATLILAFDQFYNNIGDDTAVVEVYDGTNWVEVLNQTADTGSFADPDEQMIDISAFSNAAMQIRFVYDDGDVWAWYWMIDNVQVYNSTCNFPTDLTVSNITETSADLGWTPGGTVTETDWEVINQEAGGPVPTDADSGISTTDNPYTAPALSLGTNYEFYVRTNCGADGFSIWSGPFAYRISGPGEVCENPIEVITPLPYVTTDNTENYIDDYNGTSGADCGSTFGSYLNGDDVVYAYTPTADTSIDISLSGLTGNYAGVFVYTDCANIGTQCEAGATNAFAQTDLVIDNFSVTNGQTYYIVISTWAAPQSVGYTLTITENTCVDPVVDFVVRQDCINGPQFFVDVDLTDLGSATSMTISDDQGSAAQNTTVAGIFTFGPFANNTPIIISVVNDDDANCNLTSTALTQDQCVLNQVDCTQPPLQFNYCYANNDETAWLFESTDGSPVRLTFNAGGIESCCDDILIYDGQDNTAPLIYQGNNGGDLTGLQFDSTGDSMYMEIDSDNSVSCDSGSFCCSTEWDFTVACATCVNPVATYAVVSDCLVAPQFFVDVDLTDLGSATSITVTDNQSNPAQTVSAVGVLTFGPYTNNTPVVFTVANDDDPNCTLTSTSLTQEFCLENIVDCAAGPLDAFYCYENSDTNLFTYTTSDGSPVRLTFNSGEVEGAPFDFLVVLDSDGVTELYNDEGNDGDLSGLVFQSTGDTIFFQITSDTSVSCSSGAFCCSSGIDYTVTCATCINPTATYQVIDDCDNGDQFLVDVNISSLGDATSLTISNNIDGNTVAVPATGVYQVGPFPFGVDVIITTNNDQDVNCVINSNAIQLLACPPDNDNPCDATVALVNADDSCDLITPGTLLEATDSGIAVGTCGGNPDDDVWFEFTALNEFQIIQLTNIVGGGFFDNLDHAVYEGSCDAPVELYCSADDASLTTSLTVGNTYFIRVFSSQDDNVDFTFDLCIRPGTGNVAVDQDTYTVEELVVDILIDSPCAQISNITFSTGTDFGSTNGIGYFTAEEGSFPFEDGVLLTSGDASRAGGPNFNNLSDGSFDWPGDTDLEDEVGIISRNATIIEFDFVPLSSEISFDFLMASEEYNGATGGSFECTFSDAFAFLLTDENGVTTNLAVLPGTTTPILVTNIHPENPGCPAINEEFFGGYTPQNLPPISFDGRTEVFTAFSPVNLGETYRIKLVISDASDTAFDSGVFLKAGSFDIGEVELGADITIADGTAACLGQPVVLETQAPSVPHVWFKDGFQIAGETTNILEVTEPGEYTAQLIFSPTCIISDEIVIEFLPLPIVNMPADIVECSANDQAVFDLTVNNAEILGEQSPVDFTLTYHDSEEDAINDVDELVSPYTNISNPQIIYARVENNITGCYDYTTFNILTAPPTFEIASVDIVECSTNDQAIFDLTANDAEVLGDLSPTEYTLTYHDSEDDAINDVDALVSPYVNLSNPQVIYARVEDNAAGAGCYVYTTFTISTAPPTFEIASVDIVGCDNDDDGISEFDLDAQDELVLDGLDDTQYIVTYHLSQENAEANSSALSSPYESSGETIFVRVESIDYVDCYVVTSFDLVFGTEPETAFTQDFDYEVCPDAVVPIIITATPVNYTIGDVTINWYLDGGLIENENGLTLPVVDAGDYDIEVIFNDTGCSNIATQEVIELETCVIPEGISPNGDGMNDTFDLSNFQVSKLEIFNRFGTLVYSKKNYTNEWFGQTKDGEELPVGTYFYTMEFRDGETRSAWVYVQREN
ncbi:MAG: choice-of-anchor L domain-containing protein [Psychroserpens sp.]|uniref:choice-of-anchor L domain-containing protein n=1 Tax=Psychroserpens sp. TaxID=2020870 RepID=UPI003C7549C2